MTTRTLLLMALLTGAARAQSLPATIERPVEDLAVTEELKQLEQLLKQVPDTYGQSRKFNAPDPCSVVASRLSLCFAAFGVDPRKLSRWNSLEATATDLLERIEDGSISRQLVDDTYTSQLDRYTLLTIVGREKEARRILAATKEVHQDGCFWCLAESVVVINQRRSEQLEQRGELKAALDSLHEVCLAIDGIGGFDGDDVALARYGSLLIRNGYDVEGVGVLQTVCEERPRTYGARAAQAILTSSGHKIGAPGPRLFRSMDVLAVRSEEPPRMTTVLAVRLNAWDDHPRIVTIGKGNLERGRSIYQRALGAGTVNR